MTNLSIPRLPQDITAEWLTDALRSTNTITKSKVTSFDMEPDIAAGKGFMGQLARIGLHYDVPEPGAPSSLVAKFPTYGPENRVVADLFRLYETETRFYEELADKVALRTPRRYHSARATDSTDFILLMEDLAPACVGDQVVGCSKAQSELAIRELAKFHAAWWESPRLADFDWVWTFNHPVRTEAALVGYGQAWEPFKTIWSKQVPAPVLDLGERFHAKIPKILDRLAAPPVTISHGDYRVDNLFFATPEGGDPLAVVDWQVMTIGNGLFDLAYFMSSAVPPAERRATEMDLLHMYHDILVQGGVKGYDFDQCLLDYRTSVLFCWQYAVIILGSLDTANERGMALFTDVLERFVSAIVDLKAGSCCRRDARASAGGDARMTAAPTGTVTSLFTDIEGSTRRWEAEPDAMRVALATHDVVLRSAIEERGGWMFKHTGEGVCAARSGKPSAMALIAQSRRRYDARKERG